LKVLSGVFRNLQTGGPFSRPQKVDDLFWEANICRPSFLENDQFDDLFFLLTFSNFLQFSAQIRLKGGGPSARPPVFKPFKKIFHQPRGGHGTMAPPKYATESTVFVYDAIVQPEPENSKVVGQRSIIKVMLTLQISVEALQAKTQDDVV
jgi:hypothetical protein